MDKKSRTALLARHNLEVTQRELSRCREAIRNGSIWNLAERRSHASPHLRKAFKQIIELSRRLRTYHQDVGWHQSSPQPIQFDLLLNHLAKTSPKDHTSSTQVRY